MVIAGRNKPGAQWDPLRGVTASIELDIFTEQEAEAFLDAYTIRDAKRRTEILEWSGRLPVLMSWLAAPEGKDPDPTVPTSDIVERFLRWVTEPTLREVALRGAIPHTFNVDILRLLLVNNGTADPMMDEHTAFDWLQVMPFVKQQVDGWQYHEVVRRMMLHYQRQKSPQTYRQLHATLANFYNKKRNELGLSNAKQWANEQWRKDTSAYAYHFLVADPIKHWVEIMSLFTLAVRRWRSYAIQIIELISSSDTHDELSLEQQNTVQLFNQQLRAIKDGNLQDGFEMFNHLCNTDGLSPIAKGYALAYRGECHRLREKGEKAISDFGDALNYIPKDIWTLTRRAETYLQMGRDEEALADYGCVLALDEKNSLALAGRAEIYQQMGRYEEALADYDQAIAFDRSTINRVYTVRGLVLSYLGQYAEAIESYERGLKENLNDYTSLYNIAVAMFRWKGFPAAQAYIDTARSVLQTLIHTDKHGAALYGLRGLEALVNNTDQALKYLKEALPFEQQASNWARHDIAWLDLRTDLRFQSLISKKQ